MTALSGWLFTEDGEPIWDENGEFLSVSDSWFDGATAQTSGSYQLDVCDSFVRVGVCDVFQFSGVERRNAVGEWQASIPEGGIEFQGGASIGDVDSIIIWDTSVLPATIVAAGTMNPTGSVDTGVVTTVGASGTRWTLSGVDLYGLLGTRVAYPDPASEPPWAVAYDERTGPSSTVAAGYIEDNLGAGALAARQITGASVIDGGVGEDVTWSARLQPLSTLVTSICNAAGILCRPRMAAPGLVDFVFTTGADRTTQTVISEHDVSGDISVTEARPRATWVVAGGSGEAETRKFATATNGATGLDRVESFYDVSSLTSASAVALAAQGSLAESAAETAVDFTSPIPRQWRYRTHFDVGDTISVEADGARYPAMVDAVAFTISSTGSTVRPVLGRTTNNEVTQIMRSLWGASDRFATNIT